MLLRRRTSGEASARGGGEAWKLFNREAGDVDLIRNDWQLGYDAGGERREGRVRPLWRIVVPTGAHAPSQIPEGPIRCNCEKLRKLAIIGNRLVFRNSPAAQRKDDTMFGPFRATNPLSGGLLWKIPWRLSKFQKRRHRLRLRAVDGVVATLDAALAKRGQTLEAIERWKAEMPTEEEMLPKDKYTMFDRKEKKYRKGIHSMRFLRFFFFFFFGRMKVLTLEILVIELPKWTRVSQRINPPGY